MTPRNSFALSLLASIIFAIGTVLAQEVEQEEAPPEIVPATSPPARSIADDYVAVWLVIEQQWEAVQRGEKEWVEEMLAADFIGWPKDAPHPRDKASTRRWSAFSRKQVKGLEHEIFPLETIIHGDTAIAHYLYTNAVENKEGKAEVSNGRFTDVLVRVDGKWKFIAWHGGDDDSDD